MNSDIEWAGFFGAVERSGDLYICNAIYGKGMENSASLVPASSQLWRIIEEGLTPVDVHTHGRRNGDVIQRIDPYWSVGKQTAQGLQTGLIFNQFYISKHDKADSEAMESCHNNNINYAVFIHPRFGSEGQIMSPDKVQITAYTYDATSLGRVREIGLKVVSNEELERAIQRFK